MSSEHPAVTIVVPAYNEVANLEGAVKDVLGAAEHVLPVYEIIVVDDGSTDETGILADQLARRYDEVRVIHHGRNLGLAQAYKSGLAAARLPYFAFVPGDGEVSAESIGVLLMAGGSADIVVPYHANPSARPWHRRVLTSISTAMLNHASGHRLRYYQGPCVYPTAVARSLPTTTTGFFFLTEMLVHALKRGHSFVEVGLVHKERTGGKSTAVTVPNILRALTTIVGLWWTFRVKEIE